MSPRLSLSDVFLCTQTDERLAALAGDGHQRAFAVLVERHRAALLGSAGRVVGPQRGEDVVQQALLRAWSSLMAGTQVRNVQGWLHQIVRNTAYTESARERGPTQRLTDELADPRSLAAALDQRIDAHDLLERLAALPERQRAALLKTELAGHSRQQIAAELGLSEGAVRQLVYRARTAVRVAMTAVTPYPLAAWAARRGAGPSLAQHVASLSSASGSARPGATATLAAGSAAGSGLLIKGGAVVLVTGALGGGLAWHAVTSQPRAHAATPAASQMTVGSRQATPPGRRTAIATGSNGVLVAARQPQSARKRRTAHAQNSAVDPTSDPADSGTGSSGSAAPAGTGTGEAGGPSSSGSDGTPTQQSETSSGATMADQSTPDQSTSDPSTPAQSVPASLPPDAATASISPGAAPASSDPEATSPGA